ncbi:MAG: hypothetical protein ACOY3Z_02395 [Thermodesulfobacteriota bacterium]
MSRLYNTLEKIRLATQGAESTSPSLPAPTSPANRPSHRLRFVLLGCGVVIAGAAIGLSLSLLEKQSQRQAGTVSTPAPGMAPPAASPAASAAPPPAPTGPEDVGSRYLQLNKTGMDLLRQDKQWASIHVFEQARQLKPDRPEALINMAVALAELGLRVPAQRLFKQAMALGTDHPMLQRNLDLMRQCDFLEDPAEPPLAPSAPTAPGQRPTTDTPTRTQALP